MPFAAVIHATVPVPAPVPALGMEAEAGAEKGVEVVPWLEAVVVEFAPRLVGRADSVEDSHVLLLLLLAVMVSVVLTLVVTVAVVVVLV